MNVMKTLKLCCVMLLAHASAWATDMQRFDRISSSSYSRSLNDGFRVYNRKQYSRAFGLVERAACAGDKTSQALLGRMYILGQGTAKNGVKGYAWIRTAAEFRFPQFTSLAAKLEDALSPSQRTAGNALAHEYRQRYGLVVTHMDCQGEARHGAKLIDSVVCSPKYAGGADVWVRRCDEVAPPR